MAETRLGESLRNLTSGDIKANLDQLLKLDSNPNIADIKKIIDKSVKLLLADKNLTPELIVIWYKGKFKNAKRPLAYGIPEPAVFEKMLKTSHEARLNAEIAETFEIKELQAETGKKALRTLN